MEQTNCRYCGATSLGSAYTCVRCGAAQSVPLSSFMPTPSLSCAERATLRKRVEELEDKIKDEHKWLLAGVRENNELHERIDAFEAIIEWLENAYPRQLDEARKAVSDE